jgi:hypothetical protein
MKKLFLILFIIFLLFLAQKADASLLYNGGFESGSQEPWQQLGYHWGSVADWAKYSGNYGYKIEIMHHSESDGWGGRYQNHPAQPGDIYRLGAMINTGGISPSLDKAAASLQIAFFGNPDPQPEDSPIEVYDSELLTGQSWTYLDVTSEAAPLGTESVRFTFALWASDHQYFPGDGTAFYDDVEAELIPEPATIALFLSGLLFSFGFYKKRR